MTIFDYYMTILSIGKKSIIDIKSSIYTFSYRHLLLSGTFLSPHIRALHVIFDKFLGLKRIDFCWLFLQIPFKIKHIR